MKTQVSNPLILQIVEGTLIIVVNGFLIDRRSRRLSPRTIDFYATELRYFSVFMEIIGVVNFREISADLIRQYLINLGNQRNKGGVHAAYRAIHALYAWYEFEFEPDDWKNPIRKVKIPRPNSQPLPGIKIEDIRLMILECAGSSLLDLRDRALLYFLVDTGVRACEITALNIRDVDLITGAVTVQHGKGDKRRVVFLAQKSRKELRRYLKSREFLSDNDPLFLSENEDRLSFSGLRGIVRRRASQAGLSEPGLHDFRRAFALTMLRNGSDILTVSRLLGHSSLSVTQRYLALVNEDLLLIHDRTSPGNLL